MSEERTLRPLSSYLEFGWRLHREDFSQLTGGGLVAYLPLSILALFIQSPVESIFKSADQALALLPRIFASQMVLRVLETFVLILVILRVEARRTGDQNVWDILGTFSRLRRVAAVDLVYFIGIQLIGSLVFWLAFTLSKTGLIGRLFIAVLVMLALLIVLDLVAYGRLSGTAIAFVVAVPAVLAVNHIWLVPNLGRRQHRQSAALRLPSHIAWDAEGVSFTSERGEAHVPFADFYRWDETPGTVLLYQTEMFFNLVPKVALDGEAPDLIARLQAAGVRRN